jgi:SepF-like predicted cell division protein (DUF552 family)
MSEADVERLSRLESVDTQQAEEALERSDGEFERARSLLRKAPVAVKFRFSSQEEDVYGLGVILLDVSPPGLRDLTVLVGNEQSLGTIGLSQNHSELKKLIAERSNESSTMAALSRRLREGLNDSLSPPSEDWISLIKARNESDLQLLFEEHVKNLLDQDDLVLTADLEVGLVDASVSEDDSGGSSTAERSRSDQGVRQVELICDVKVSPVKGQAVQSLQPGDVIFVDISEEQNDDAALVEVIEQLRDDEVGLIPAQIDRLGRTETGKVEITVQFGENVFGRTVVGEDMNILTPSSVSELGSSMDGLFSFLPWVVAGLALLTIGIIFLWMLVFPL